MVANTGNTAGTTTHGMVVTIAQDIPLVLSGGDASRASTANIDTVFEDGVTDWVDDTAVVIDLVEIVQTSGNSAKVRVVAIG